jgi:hypothetical protein
MTELLTLNIKTAEKALVEHLIRREVVVFAGAGVSTEAQPPLPDWKGLIDTLLPHLPSLPPKDTPDSLDVAQWFVNEHGRRTLEERLVAGFSNEATKPSPLQDALAALPVNVYFTTNYDQLIEKALARQGRFADTIVDDRHVGLINDLTTTTVVKLHGCVSLSDTIVLARDDYEHYEDRHRAMITYLQSLLATRVFLFVGFSFTDPDFRAIHTAIQRILGPYHRRAYAIKLGQIHPLVARQWQNRGIDFIEIPTPEGIVAFVNRLANGAKKASHGGTSLPHMLRTLGERQSSVATTATRIEQQLQAIRRDVSQLLEEASASPDLRLDRRLLDAADPDAQTATLDNVRALFGLGQTLERMGLALEPDEWQRLGNALYQHREWPLAIQAYTYARSNTRGDDRWAEGNLARAYLRLQQYARAEALLRQLVFQPRGDVSELREDWLHQRPADLSEYGYVINRRAEQLREDGRLNLALEILKETRQWLRQGVTANWIQQPMDAPRERHTQERSSGRGTSSLPYLLNHLGKNYRLAYEMHVALGKAKEAERLRRKAVRNFLQSIEEAPLLLYPRGHLIGIYEQNLLDNATADKNLRLNIDQVESLAKQNAAGKRMRDALYQRHTSAWEKVRH